MAVISPAFATTLAVSASLGVVAALVSLRSARWSIRLFCFLAVICPIISAMIRPSISLLAPPHVLADVPVAQTAAGALVCIVIKCVWTLPPAATGYLATLAVLGTLPHRSKASS